MYGMKPDEYWHGKAELFWAYRTSFILKEKREFDKSNYLSWLNGLYNQRAIASSMGAKDQLGQSVSYFEKPIDFFGLNEEKMKTDLKEQNERNVRTMIAQSHLSLLRKQKKQE
jgi:hypothetical protein